MKKGFTIIELLVVIVIIGILAGIVMTVAAVVKEKGKDAAIKTELSQFYMLAASYFQSHNQSYAAMFTRGNQDPDAIAIQTLYDQLPAFQNCKQSAYKSDNSGWAICAVLNFPLNQTKAWCIDATGAKTEICADQCKTSGIASGDCPVAGNNCTAPTGPNSCD